MKLTRIQIRIYWEHRHPNQRIGTQAKVAVKCAFHDDHSPSCTLFLDGNGAYHCHGCGAKGSLFQFEMRISQCDAQQAELNVAAITGAKPNPRLEGKENLGLPTDIYDYRDESGRVLFQKRRYEPELGGKTFRSFHETERGWKAGIDPKDGPPTRRVLLNLPDLVKADIVLLAEGEKCCRALMNANLFPGAGFSIAATTSHDGAWKPDQNPKWLDDYNKYFSGKHVFIFPDNDESGREYANHAARSISPFASKVKIVNLPGLLDKGDVFDFLRDHSVRDLETLMKNAPTYTPATPVLNAGSAVLPSSSKSGFKFEKLGDLLERPIVPVDYLVDGLLVRGTLSCLVAKPKVGKSTLARVLSFAVATGQDFLGRKTAHGTVLYLALEERAEEVLADFRAMGADATTPIQVHACAAPQDAVHLLAELVRKDRPALVVCDPLFRMLRVRDEKAYAEVYSALGPLIDAARDSGTHILLTHHAGKSQKADAIDSPLGSTAIGGAVSTLIQLTRTETNRFIQTVQRVGADLPQTVLEFDEPSRLLTLGGTKAEVHSVRVEGRIVEFLKSGKEKLEQEITDGVVGRNTTKRSALRALRENGTVNRSGAGKKEDPYLYSLSRSPHMAGTRERESESGVQTTVIREEMLVPNFVPNPKLVPESQVDELDVSNVNPANLQHGGTTDNVKGEDEEHWLWLQPLS